MFMKFELYSHQNDMFEAPVGADDGMPQQKICLNLKTIDNVQQSGQYRQVPVEPRPGEEEHLEPLVRRNQAAAGGPVRPRAQRRREVFFLHPDRFIIYMQNGNNYTVMGNFDEFCEILTNFRDKLESV